MGEQVLKLTDLAADQIVLAILLGMVWANWDRNYRIQVAAHLTA